MADAVEEVTNGDALAKLRAWLAVTRKQACDVGLDTHLIREGVLDSLEMVNFLLYIEELRGREIPEALMQPEYFTSLRVIQRTFFNGHPTTA